jgi:hypothetical protein
MPSETQILNQINVNYNTIEKVGEQVKQNPPAWKQAELERQLQSLWQAQQYWAKEYFRVTGKSIVLFSEIQITGDPYAMVREEDAIAKAKANEQKLLDSIHAVHNDYQRIRLLLQSQYDISVEWQNAIFSHLSRMGSGLDAQHPLRIKKQIEENVWPRLMDAEKAFNSRNFQKAWQKLNSAAKWLKWGFDAYNLWMSRLETGGKVAIAGIKVSAAVATLIVSAPAEVGVLGGMGIAAVSEASTQGTTLMLKALDPGDTVTLEDVKNAALSVAVNAGSAGLGKGLGKLVAKGLSPIVARRILKEPTEEAIKKVSAIVEAKVEQYVSANAQTIAGKMLKLDKEPDWNWWYMAVAPSFNSVTMELVKDPDLNKRFKGEASFNGAW